MTHQKKRAQVSVLQYFAFLVLHKCTCKFANGLVLSECKDPSELLRTYIELDTIEEIFRLICSSQDKTVTWIFNNEMRSGNVDVIFI